MHMGINNILKLRSNAKRISNSIPHIANQCKAYVVNKVSILSVTCTTPLNSDLIDDVNSSLRYQCQITG